MEAAASSTDPGRDQNAAHAPTAIPSFHATPIIVPPGAVRHVDIEKDPSGGECRPGADLDAKRVFPGRVGAFPRRVDHRRERLRATTERQHRDPRAREAHEPSRVGVGRQTAFAYQAYDPGHAGWRR